MTKLSSKPGLKESSYTYTRKYLEINSLNIQPKNTIDQQIFIHNIWQEDEIETVSIYLPIPIYNSDDPTENPEFLIVKQIQWSYSHQFWLTVNGYRLLDPLIKVSIKVEKDTKFFAELDIAISLLHQHQKYKPSIYPSMDELSFFMESGLGSFEKFYKSKINEIHSVPN